MTDFEKQSDSLGISLRWQRRAVLKMMFALPMARLVPVALFAAEATQALPEISLMPEGSAPWKLHVLTPHEWTTICTLSDWIIPADEDSGSATDAGVPEFIDDWLDFQRGDLLTEIREGLAWLDAACNRSFGMVFVNCTADHQKQMLDRIAWPQSTAANDAHGVVFFSRLRDLVLSGFYTSEIGIRYLPYIGNEPQREWQGCPVSVLEQLGV